MRPVLPLLFSLLTVATVYADGPDELPPKEALKKAKVGDKYSKLLRKISVKEDFSAYGEFHDYGHYTGSSWGGHDDLPPGYWVYVYPHWYIFGRRIGDVVLPELEEPPMVEEEKPKPGAKRSYGPEQATGPPDVPLTTDSPSAWCPANIDERAWLEVEFKEPIQVADILVYENYTTGALVKVVGFSAGGMDVELWSGDDPATTHETSTAVAKVRTDVKLKTKRIRILLDCGKVNGWTEIDTVGVVDRGGKKHWPIKAKASSTYGLDAKRSGFIIDSF